MNQKFKLNSLRTCSIIFTAVFVASCGTDVPPPAPTTSAKLHDELQSLVDNGLMPGAVVLIADRDSVLDKIVVGFQDIAEGLPMSEGTIFRLYSMSKPITSVATMTLVEDGSLALDQAVDEILPDFKDMRVYESGTLDDMVTVPVDRPITISDLLTHTAGITYHFTGTTPVHEYYRKYGVLRDTPVGRSPEDGEPAHSLDELVARLGKAPMLNQPGTEFAYSYSTTVLGGVIERVSGKTLDEFLQ
jgi:CubicO group peptidase (beta-lactamase class C family)